MYIERNSHRTFFAYIKQRIAHEGSHCFKPYDLRSAVLSTHALWWNCVLWLNAKKKKEKNEAEFIPRELPSESPSNKRQTFDTNMFCHCSMPECWDDMVQCELCEEWLHMSYEGFKTAPGSEWLCIVCRPLDSKRLRNCYDVISDPSTVNIR